MYPTVYSEKTPDKAAIIMASSGEVVSYKMLEEESNRLAHYFQNTGLKKGDHIAFLIENSYFYFYCLWAAQRMGLYYTPINAHLTAGEIAYILDDCKAKTFITTTRFADVAHVAKWWDFYFSLACASKVLDVRTLYLSGFRRRHFFLEDKK